MVKLQNSFAHFFINKRLKDLGEVRTLLSAGNL
jgi:hypothetical protein